MDGECKCVAGGVSESKIWMEREFKIVKYKMGESAIIRECECKRWMERVYVCERFIERV